MLAMSMDPDKDMLALPAEAKSERAEMLSAPPSAERNG